VREQQPTMTDSIFISQNDWAACSKTHSAESICSITTYAQKEKKRTDGQTNRDIARYEPKQLNVLIEQCVNPDKERDITKIAFFLF
jgi:hypothetical protein